MLARNRLSMMPWLIGKWQTDVTSEFNLFNIHPRCLHNTNTSRKSDGSLEVGHRVTVAHMTWFYVFCRLLVLYRGGARMDRCWRVRNLTPILLVNRGWTIQVIYLTMVPGGFEAEGPTVPIIVVFGFLGLEYCSIRPRFGAWFAQVRAHDWWDSCSEEIFRKSNITCSFIKSATEEALTVLDIRQNFVGKRKSSNGNCFLCSFVRH